MPEIAPSVLVELEAAQVERNIVRLNRQLDRQSYIAVNKVLENLGGKWNRKLKGHEFSGDANEIIEQAISTGTYEKGNKYDFFETPASLVERMIELAVLRPDLEAILEPSAGRGAIADAVSRIVGQEKVHTIEIDQARSDVLRAKKYDHTQGDFLLTKRPLYDRVLLNPPFSRQQDIDHVTHAWRFVKPGGRLVAIMSSSVTFRQNKKTVTFRELVDRHGFIEPNPEGAFKSSGTAVNTVMVVLDKPAI